MAIRNLGIPYDCIGWSEIDQYAIRAHNAVFPEIADRNLGDMTKIDWGKVPDFDLLFYSTPCTDFSNAGKQAGGRGRFRHSFIHPMVDAVCDYPKEAEISGYGECKGFDF